ncbi:MAG TPA: DUF1684 domain-containing protein [Chitinophagaceae bacterium]|nr:DUF1684 domain-containing protein [Chitinophagaceae bacterium]
MRIILTISLLVLSTILLAQEDSSLLLESAESQKELNELYLNQETSILEIDDFKKFKGLEFYPIDSKYIVRARFIRTPNEKPFLMPTSTSRLPEYVKYGEAHFNLDGKELILSLYQNIDLAKDSEYAEYLFLPFTDLTSGNGSYGGGRYLDLQIPKGDSLIIDFNKAYNPYCAYNSKYSCPIPPEENDILVSIKAGVKDYNKS